MSATRIFFFPLDNITEMPRIWRLINPTTGERRELLNHRAWQPLYLKLLEAGWQDSNEDTITLIDNDDQSLAGYAEPAAPRSLKTDGRAAIETDGTENESE